MLFGRRKPGYTTTVDAASDPEQVILDLQKAEMAAKKKPKADKNKKKPSAPAASPFTAQPNKKTP